MPPMKSPSNHEPPEGMEDSVTLIHLAKRWKVSRREIRRLLQTGELPFVQVEGQIRVPVEAVLAMEKSLSEKQT